ncbi:Hsp20/alpha crystallin family protein [Candidatus Kaiserbacteria bacterium]|nr:Hsp20/alpha crystallin family protein [Candidatus Kaiserbacteria bacterium]
MKKSSFLERLTGAVSLNKYDEVLDEDHEFSDEGPYKEQEYDDESEWHGVDNELEEEPQDGELPVDMYHTGEAIVIRALVAGVSPEDLDIAITRDMVTIKGVREEFQETDSDNYYHRELFWGGFTRTLLLPEEVVIDEAEAHEKHGMLEIRLPKVDKDRSTRLKVRAHTPK